MDRYLLEHIKELEQKLTKIKHKEEKLQKIVLTIKKLCKPILEINLIKRDIKEKIVKYLNNLGNNLFVEDFEKLYNGNLLNKKGFFEIANQINFEKHFIFILKLRDSNELDFVSSFIESKFTPYLYIEVNKIIGILEKEKLKEFENTKFIPYFKDKYIEINFFVVFFETDKFDELEFKKMLNIFDRFYLKPSMAEKRYVHYSLIENKIIDFEAIQKEKIKKEFSYLHDLKYPEIELLLRKEIKNTKFVLALLDRIDTELKEIKQSKGRSIVVKRILGFIFKHQLDPEIQEMTKLIFQALEKEDYIKG